MLSLVASLTALTAVASFYVLAHRYRQGIIHMGHSKRVAVGFVTILATAACIATSIALCIKFDQVRGFEWLDIANVVLCVYLFVLGWFIGGGLILSVAIDKLSK